MNNHTHLLTPYKLPDPVLTGSGIDGAFDRNAVDSPTPFYHNGRYFMMYIGFDGKGYQTALAVSDDLLHWGPYGLILPRGGNMDWDRVGMSGNSLLMENDLFGPRKLKKAFGKYWLLYHAYPLEGYEAGSAQIGLAWTEDEALRDWHFLGKPVLTWQDGAAWERGGLYKGWLMEHDGLFHIFYNAKNLPEEPWQEQIGLATSADLLNWTRNEQNPLLPVTEGAWDNRFAADPCVFWDSQAAQWVMYYYGFDGHAACEGLAFSDDLTTWRKHPQPIIVPGQGDALDRRYAHKPGVIFADGVLYHYYCAVRAAKPGDATATVHPHEFRCIALATDVPR